MLVLQRAEPANARPDERTDTITIHPVEIQTGIVERLPARHHAQLGEPVGASDFLGRGKGRGGIKVPDLAGNGAGIAPGVEHGDLANATLAGAEVLPEGADPLAKRRIAGQRLA